MMSIPEHNSERMIWWRYDQPSEVGRIKCVNQDAVVFFIYQCLYIMAHPVEPKNSNNELHIFLMLYCKTLGSLSQVG